MSNYVLITFYNRQTESNPAWEVYGHIAPHNNKHIATFKTWLEAAEFSLRCGVPVMQGTNKEHVVEKLRSDNSPIEGNDGR